MSVGVFLRVRDSYSQRYQAHAQAQLDLINEMLLLRGLPTYAEPRQKPTVYFDLRRPEKPMDTYSGFGRSLLDHDGRGAIHRLQQLAAHVFAGGGAVRPKIDRRKAPERDPVLQQVFASGEHHLVSHAASEGFWIPVEFDRVLVEERLDGRFLGSSHRLRDDLIAIAPALGIPLADGGVLGDATAWRICDGDAFQDRPGSDAADERTTWLLLHEAARMSLQHGAAIALAG